MMSPRRWEDWANLPIPFRARGTSPPRDTARQTNVRLRRPTIQIVAPLADAVRQRRCPVRQRFEFLVARGDRARCKQRLQARTEPGGESGVAGIVAGADIGVDE